MKLPLPFLTGVLLMLGCSYVQAFVDAVDIQPADIPNSKPRVIRSRSFYGMMQACERFQSANVVVVNDERYKSDPRLRMFYCVKRKIKHIELPQGSCEASTQPQKQSQTRHLWTHCNGDNHRVELEVCDADKDHENCQTIPWYSEDVKRRIAPPKRKSYPQKDSTSWR